MFRAYTEVDFADALSNNRAEHALTDLNDATTALMDGVFAVMTTVYECFLGHAEPERMIPGHRDTLQQCRPGGGLEAVERGQVHRLRPYPSSLALRLTEC